MMPRISTSARQSQDQGSRRKKILITLFMAIIMISSIGGFILSYNGDTSVKLDYNQFKIESSSTGTYITHLKDGKLIFTVNHPTSLESISIERPVWDLLESSRVVSITYNQSDEHAEGLAGAQFMLEKNLGEAGRIFVQRGLLNANGTSLLNVSCADATPSTPVILLKIGEPDEAPAIRRESCIILSGIVGLDVERVADRIIFGMAEVMPRGN